MAGSTVIMTYMNEEQLSLIQRTVEIQKEVTKTQLDIMTRKMVKAMEIQTDINNLQFALVKSLIKDISDLKIYTDNLKESLKSIDNADIENVKRANVLILNYTVQALGSGTHIRIRNQDYILTAGHMIDKKDDIIRAKGDYGDEYVLKLMKVDEYNDLALFRIEGGCPKLGTLEISDIYPKVGSEVTVIGNPAGDEDIVTDGTLCKIEDQFYKVTNKAFFGNSGGAMLYKGKLVGVCSQVDLKVNFPIIVIYTRFVKLPIIKEFLREFTEPIYRILPI
jgi:S1-C subfamily serine protease